MRGWSAAATGQWSCTGVGAGSRVRGALELREFRDVHAPSWRAWWRGSSLETELVGDASLSARPMDRVAEPLGLMGATVAGHGTRCLPPLLVRGGGLHGIDWTAKVVSAQVKSAILLAGLSAEETTIVREAVTTRTHTEEMLLEAGADLTVEPWGEGRIVRVRTSSLKPVERTVPGDPSASAFFAVAGCVGARERRRRRRRVQRPGPARLRQRPAADG